MSGTDLRQRAMRRHRARCGRVYTGHRPGWALVAVTVARVQGDETLRATSIPHFLRGRVDGRPRRSRSENYDPERRGLICWPYNEALAIANRINAGETFEVKGTKYRDLATVVRC